MPRNSNCAFLGSPLFIPSCCPLKRRTLSNNPLQVQILTTSLTWLHSPFTNWCLTTLLLLHVVLKVDHSIINKLYIFGCRSWSWHAQRLRGCWLWTIRVTTQSGCCRSSSCACSPFWWPTASCPSSRLLWTCCFSVLPLTPNTMMVHLARSSIWTKLSWWVLHGNLLSSVVTLNSLIETMLCLAPYFQYYNTI